MLQAIYMQYGKLTFSFNQEWMQSDNYFKRKPHSLTVLQHATWLIR